MACESRSCRRSPILDWFPIRLSPRSGSSLAAERFTAQSVAQALADRQMLRSGDVTVRSSASVSLGRLVIVIASAIFRVDRAATDRRVRFEPFRIGLFL
jgi:hypothetical protein